VQKRIDLSLDAAEDATVRGHAQMLHEMVSNLVHNAISYTPAGGHVALHVAREGDEVVLAVEDSGPGIPAAERDTVFAPFYRAATSLETNPDGTGLGLTIVRDIAKQHGADIALMDASGGGLKVELRFPAAPEPNKIHLPGVSPPIVT
jgi:two-component system sensor histidine kinase TctE